MRSVVSNVRLHANSIESTSALLAPSLVAVVVCDVVLLAGVTSASAASRTALGGVVCVSTSPVEDDGSPDCGDGGADGRQDFVSTTSWSLGGQSVDVVDSGTVLGWSDVD